MLHRQNKARLCGKKISQIDKLLEACHTWSTNSTIDKSLMSSIFVSKNAIELKKRLN